MSYGRVPSAENFSFSLPPLPPILAQRVTWQFFFANPNIVLFSRKGSQNLLCVSINYTCVHFLYAISFGYHFPGCGNTQFVGASFSTPDALFV